MKPVWRDGNAIRLLENGEQFFPRVFEAIRAARVRVYIETFILLDDKVGLELLDVLCDAAARGVEVDVLADGFGSEPLGADYRAQLAAIRIDQHDRKDREQAAEKHELADRRHLAHQAHQRRHQREQ